MTRCLYWLWYAAGGNSSRHPDHKTVCLAAAPKPFSGSMRVAVLLAVIALLNILDLIYTLFAHHAGVLKEMNPIAANFLRLDVVPSLVSYKLLTMLLGSFILWKARRSPWAGGACWLLVVVYTALAVMWVMWMHTYLSVQPLIVDLNSPIVQRPAMAAGF